MAVTSHLGEEGFKVENLNVIFGLKSGTKWVVCLVHPLIRPEGATNLVFFTFNSIIYLRFLPNIVLRGGPYLCL